MNLYSLFLPAGSVGVSHDSTSPTFTSGFLPGVPLFLSFELAATRVSGSSSATVHVEVQWKNAAGAALTPFTADIVVTNSIDVLQRYTVTPPATAATGVCYIKITPAASPTQHDFAIQHLRLGKTAIMADVTAENTAVGDGNRVAFSLFERGATGWSWYTPVTLTGTAPTVNTTLVPGRVFLAQSRNWTAANQFFVTNNDGSNSQYLIPVRPSERVWAGARLAVDTGGAATQTWALYLRFYDSTLAQVGIDVQLASGTGNPGGAVFGNFATAPSTAFSASLLFYVYNGSTGATYATSYFGEPMLCSAGINQTTPPTFNRGPSNLQADAATSVIIDPPADITIYADSTGAVKAGQLEKDVGLSASIGTARVTTLGTWTMTATNGITCSIGANTGILAITGFTASEVYIPINFTYNGVSRDVKVHVIRKDDPQTNTSGGTGGGSSTGGTTASTTTLGATAGTSYNATSLSPVIQAKAGSNGRVDLSANVAFTRNTATLGTTTTAGKWQWRIVGGTFADVTTEAANAYGATTSGGNGDPVNQDSGSLVVTAAKTGLTNGTTYEFQFDWRRTSSGIGSTTDVFASNANMTATGS